jgi:hypothetical protein
LVGRIGLPTCTARLLSGSSTSSSHYEHNAAHGPRKQGETAIPKPIGGEKTGLSVTPDGHFDAIRAVWISSKSKMRTAAAAPAAPQLAMAAYRRTVKLV